MLWCSNMMYMLVRYPSGPMCLRCMMLTSSDSLELLYCFLGLCCGECYYGCL